MGKQLTYIAALTACLAGPCLPAQCAALGSGLNLSGQTTLIYRWQDVKGTSGAYSLFSADYLELAPGVERRSDLLLSGELLPGLRVEGSIRQGYLGSDSRWTLGYRLADADLAVGDITATLDGNPLLAMRRTLKGLRLQGEMPGGEFTIMASEAKAPVRTDAFFGRNTSGPYYLTASPIVDGSERVELDGRPLSRGRDYSLDYDIGLLQFDPSIIVPPTSKITATYEHFTPGGAGRLMAVRLAHSSGRLKVGTTYAALGAARSPSSCPRRDRWLGNNSMGPFTLTQRPLVPASEQVLVAGIVQTRDLHYHIDYLAGQITFTFPIPLGTPVEVLYLARAEGSSARDVRLLGFDLAFQPSRQTRLEAYLARSGLATDNEAGATQVRLAGEWDRLSIEANLRRASPAFYGIDGGQRVDSERSVRVTFRPASYLAVSGDVRAVRQPDFAYSQPSGRLLTARREQEWRAELNVPGWPSLAYSRARRTSRALDGSADSEDTSTESLSLAYSQKAFGASASLVRTEAAGVRSLAYGSAGFDGPYRASNRNLRLNAWYRPSDRLSVTYDAGATRLAAIGQTGSVPARSRRVAVSYSPSSRLCISLSDIRQSTGAASALSLPAYNTAMSMISVQYTPSARWSATMAADRQTFSGSGSTNSTASSLSGGIALRPSPCVSLDVQLTRQTVASLAASGKSANNILSAAVHVGPWRRLTADVGFQRLNGLLYGSFNPLGSTISAPAGASAFASREFRETAQYALSASSAWRGRLAYDIVRRQSLFAEAERLRGSRYLGAGRTDAAAIGWQYRLTKQVSLIADFRRIRHRDPDDSRRDYSANLFSAQLAFDF